MDPTIVGAVIGAAGAVIAAIVGVIVSRRRTERSASHVLDNARRANFLRLGFESGMLDFLEAVRVHFHALWSAIGYEGIAVQRKKIVALGSVLGIEQVPAEPNSLLEALSDHLMREPLALRRNYDIGFNIASGFGTGILMQLAAVPGHREEVEETAFALLRRTESVLKEAELPKRFLKPVRRLWGQFSRDISDGDHDIGDMTKDLRKCVEDLALTIERARFAAY